MHSLFRNIHLTYNMLTCERAKRASAQNHHVFTIFISQERTTIISNAQYQPIHVDSTC